MKNLKLILLAIVIVIFFTRCEKESYIEDSIIVVDQLCVMLIGKELNWQDEPVEINITFK